MIYGLQNSKLIVGIVCHRGAYFYAHITLILIIVMLITRVVSRTLHWTNWNDDTPSSMYKLQYITDLFFCPPMFIETENLQHEGCANAEVNLLLKENFKPLSVHDEFDKFFLKPKT
jgi:hypothetical protein